MLNCTPKNQSASVPVELSQASPELYTKIEAKAKSGSGRMVWLKRELNYLKGLLNSMAERSLTRFAGVGQHLAVVGCWQLYILSHLTPRSEAFKLCRQPVNIEEDGEDNGDKADRPAQEPLEKDGEDAAGPLKKRLRQAFTFRGGSTFF